METTLHTDTALFAEAINLTATNTGFSPRMIEKDYYCSLVLTSLARKEASELVFKGGTCLAKVHSGFYRLSEDLDFLVSVPLNSGRSERRGRAAQFAATISELPESSPCFAIEDPPMGHNESRQYIASITYPSNVASCVEKIKIEVSLREPLLLPHIEGLTNTVLLDPVSGARAIPAFPVSSISFAEAMAEKLRAALTRTEPAIRDFYDLAYVLSGKLLRLDDPILLELVPKKLAVPGNPIVDVSPTRLAALERQLEGRLRPVLRHTDYAGFDLHRVFAQVAGFAGQLEGREKS